MLASSLTRVDMKLFKNTINQKLDVASSPANCTEQDYCLGLVVTDEMTKEESAAVRHALRASRITRGFILDAWNGGLSSVLTKLNQCFLLDAVVDRMREERPRYDPNSVLAGDDGLDEMPDYSVDRCEIPE